MGKQSKCCSLNGKMLVLGICTVACGDYGNCGNGKSVTGVPPDVTVLNPDQNYPLEQGGSVAIEAIGSDVMYPYSSLSVSLFANGQKICPDATVGYDGLISCVHTFEEVGETNLVVEVVNPENLMGSDSARLLVLPGEPPSVSGSILSPNSYDDYYTDVPIEFSGLISYLEGEYSELLVHWYSSEDDLIYGQTPDFSGSFEHYASLSPGEHTITLEYHDESGNTLLDEVNLVVREENEPPLCEITIPENASFIFGEVVHLTATATDTQVPSSMLNVVWESSIDDFLGTVVPESNGDVFLSTSSLSMGEHLISLTVTDDLGSICEKTTILSVSMVSSFELISPEANEQLPLKGVGSFSLSLDDGVEYASNLSVELQSDQQGVLNIDNIQVEGKFISFESMLEIEGTHNLTISLTDTSGNMSSESVLVKVQ